MTEDEKAKILKMALREVWSRDEAIEARDKLIFSMETYIAKLEQENDELRRWKNKLGNRLCKEIRRNYPVLFKEDGKLDFDTLLKTQNPFKDDDIL